MSIKKMLAVARWEFIEKVRTKAFIISLIVTPVFIILMSVVPTLLMTKPDTTATKIGIIDKTGEISPVLSDELFDKFKLPDGKPNYEIISIPAGDRDRANKMVLQDQISSYIVIDTGITRTRKFEYVSQNVSNFKELERLQGTVKDIIVSKELQRNGVNPGLVKEVSNRENFIIDRNGERIAIKVGPKDSGFQTANYEDLSQWEEKRGEAESERLLYVGMTRARDFLVLPINWVKEKKGEKPVPEESFLGYVQPYLTVPDKVSFGKWNEDMMFYDTNKLELEPEETPPFRSRFKSPEMEGGEASEQCFLKGSCGRRRKRN